MCVCLCVCIGGETCLKDQAEMTVGSGRGEGGMPLKRVDRVQFHDHPTGVCWLDERGQQVGRGGDKTILWGGGGLSYMAAKCRTVHNDTRGWHQGPSRDQTSKPAAIWALPPPWP